MPGSHSRGFPTIHLSKIRQTFQLLATGDLQPSALINRVAHRNATFCFVNRMKQVFLSLVSDPLEIEQAITRCQLRFYISTAAIGWSSFWMTFPMSEAGLCRGIFFCQAPAQRKSLHPLFLFQIGVFMKKIFVFGLFGRGAWFFSYARLGLCPDPSGLIWRIRPGNGPGSAP